MEFVLRHDLSKRAGFFFAGSMHDTETDGAAITDALTRQLNQSADGFAPCSNALAGFNFSIDHFQNGFDIQHRPH